MATDILNSGTGAGLLDFLDYLKNRGIAPEKSIEPLKVTVRSVLLKMEGENGAAALDLRGLDVEEYLARFGNKFRSDYTPDSLRAYERRFTKAVEHYRAFLADPKGWKYPSRPSAQRSPQAKPKTNGRGANGASPLVPAAPDLLALSDTVDGLIDYPFPLRDGKLAVLRLPIRLAKEDADRIARHVQTLVFEPQPQISATAGEDALGEH